ncbi:MAG: iron ABC transporter permease [Deltaproteobacteria bacterium]|jgi:iron complex transport system permease protein|nr:iron ABC transporter permease [Deltaproteobacteria bacterium]
MIFRRKLAALLVLLGLLTAAFFPAIISGAYDIKAGQVFSIIWAKAKGQSEPKGASRADQVIVWRIRLPRVILAVAAGMALSVAGVAYQGCFRNPLVEPYILGVSAGASCGASLAIVFPNHFPGTQITAFVFALMAVMISYGLARNRGQISPVALVLSGVIVGALFSAVVGVMKYLAADTQLREITFWMMGGLYYATWADARLAAAVIGPAFLLIWYFGWHLNVLSLGDEEARGLGLNPTQIRLLLVAVATLAASVCVSICGIIAWVGLMAPHAARFVFGPDNRWVAPGAAILGAVYLLVCDTVARTLTAAEIPLGIITSILGAPYLLWLLRRKGGEIYGQ